MIKDYMVKKIFNKKTIEQKDYIMSKLYNRWIT